MSGDDHYTEHMKRRERQGVIPATRGNFNVTVTGHEEIDGEALGTGPFRTRDLIFLRV